jgi:hypothetical protein
MAEKRVLSKKIRFEVFKRDGFHCAYCGQSPPAVVLEVDHIEPRSKGGTDDINNLITACFDCNRGKRDIPLDKIPSQLSENIEVLREKEEQLAEYKNFIKSIEKRTDRDVKEIEKAFQEVYGDRSFTDKFVNGTVKHFLKQLPVHEIIEAMNIALSRKDDHEGVIKYFCGVCWTKIKSKSDPNYERLNKLKYYWKKQPRGSGYLPIEELRLWVGQYSDEEIKRAMDTARGHWGDLKEILG